MAESQNGNLPQSAKRKVYPIKRFARANCAQLLPPMAEDKQAGPVLSFNNIALGGKSGGVRSSSSLDRWLI